MKAKAAAVEAEGGGGGRSSAGGGGGGGISSGWRQHQQWRLKSAIRGNGCSQARRLLPRLTAPLLAASLQATLSSPPSSSRRRC